MKILIFRLGAFGDTIIITPVLRYLHKQGHELYVIVNERGMQVLKGNPHVKLLIEQKTDSVPVDQLSKHISYMQKKHGCEKVIDFSESIEVALSLHPRSPEYKLPKFEKLNRFNRNFYEYSFEHAGQNALYDSQVLKPELFFDNQEIDKAKSYLSSGFNILMGMSGSGSNKAWPYSVELAEKICQEIPQAHIITVGDERCQMIEPIIDGRVTNLSGKVSMRTSMALTGVVDLVISPDTGLLHASGCYDTPKIGILGHTTIENITKHFANDYSVESDGNKAPCSPCFFLVYNMKLQCPVHSTGAALCMGAGLPVDTIMNQVRKVYARFQESSKN